MQIRVFIVSNMRLYREGLAVLLRGCPSIEVLGANDVQRTEQALRATPTDVKVSTMRSRFNNLRVNTNVSYQVGVR